VPIALHNRCTIRRVLRSGRAFSFVAIRSIRCQKTQSIHCHRDLRVVHTLLASAVHSQLAGSQRPLRWRARQAKSDLNYESQSRPMGGGNDLGPLNVDPRC
jgi:hypothetical protein